MLSELSIKNFAIIDDLRIQFGAGLTIFSGETGAGKSIIINAVNLILGSRASATLVRTGAESAELEALFEIAPQSRAAAIMAEHGYDVSDGLIIRRVISTSDRHRIYINGRLATMQLLKAVTQNLASISGQHAHQGLLKEDQQLLILDHFGELIPLRTEVSIDFHEIVPLIQKRNELKTLKSRQAEHIELLSFQKREILDAAILPDEDQQLEQERNRLKNAETLYRTVHDSIETLYGQNSAIVDRLVETRKALEKATQFDPQLSSTTKRLAEAAFSIEDITENLRSYLKAIHMDERHLEEIETRLDALNKFKRKYGGSLEAITLHLESIEKELYRTENISDQIAATEKKLTSLQSQLSRRAQALSKQRAKTAKALAAKVEKQLSTLKMSQTEFEVSLTQTPEDRKADPHLNINGHTLTDTGIDRLAFMIAPNVGEALKPLAQIASGGELSRVVLALKSILAASDSVESIVFDEVDAGIGGGVAEVVGKQLFHLARHSQVICITHLPQIATFGDHHFKVMKAVSKGRTRTSLAALDHPQRINEIARMLGGEKITPATLAHAREMLIKDT
ncbi:MAG: DNA repair protein RecN [Deltaproteobacteria bacterium]|nr:DNA repair protein RecN [Deltaproteobacteria bacterium]